MNYTLDTTHKRKLEIDTISKKEDSIELSIWGEGQERYSIKIANIKGMIGTKQKIEGLSDNCIVNIELEDKGLYAYIIPVMIGDKKCGDIIDLHVENEIYSKWCSMLNM